MCSAHEERTEAEAEEREFCLVRVFAVDAGVSECVVKNGTEVEEAREGEGESPSACIE